MQPHKQLVLAVFNSSSTLSLSNTFLYLNVVLLREGLEQTEIAQLACATRRLESVIPPSDYDYKNDTAAATDRIVKERHPELQEIADNGMAACRAQRHKYLLSA